MTTRDFVTGLLGGILMFIWVSIAHLVLPLGQVGIREIPNEKAALVALSSSIGRDSGLYLFPALGSDTMQQYGQKLAIYPSGLLVYHPPGRPAMTFGQLAIELLTEIIEALLAVWLLLRSTTVRFVSRVGFVAVVGLLGVLVTNVSYWNWFGFPLNYTVAYMLTPLAGFVLVGVVAAARTRAGNERK